MNILKEKWDLNVKFRDIFITLKLEDLDRSKDQMLALFSSSCLTGLGLGDSHLVTLFLFSLTLFLCNVFCFCSLLFFFVLLLRWCFLASSSFLNIFFLTYQKKMSRVMTYMLTWDRKPLHEEVQLNTSNWEENKREEERVPA